MQLEVNSTFQVIFDQGITSSPEFFVQLSYSDIEDDDYYNYNNDEI